MKKQIKNHIGLIVVLMGLQASTLFAQAPTIEWNKCLGGDFTSFDQTSDGGYIIAGTSATECPNLDIWLIKLDANGDTVWSTCIGGSGEDNARAVYGTDDGGCIVFAYTYSDDGDVTGNHGESDIWLIKYNTTGNISWTRCMGGSSMEEFTTVNKTDDGGFILAGFTYSTDGNVWDNPGGGKKNWLIKFDAALDTVWTKSIELNQYGISSIDETADGGYIVAGVKPDNDDYDYWIAKLSATLDTVWTKTYGGSDNDIAVSILQTTDGNYLVSGDTRSSDRDVSGFHPGSGITTNYTDLWILKLDNTGDTLWTKCMGGSYFDQLGSSVKMPDGGCILGGYASYNDDINFNNGDIHGNHGWSDYWIIRLDINGDTLWTKCVGGTADEICHFIKQTSDGGFIMGGETFSSDGDVTTAYGTMDFGKLWIVKLSPDYSGIWENNKFSNPNIFPNPATNQVTIQTEGLKTWELLDLNGKITGSGSENTINLDPYSKGLYLLKVITQQGITYEKIVLE